MAPRGRGRAPGPSKSGQGARGGLATLEPPMMDRNRIVETYGKGIAVKPEWINNPKSPFANHVGNTQPIKYVSQVGSLNGKKVTR
jgi:hypothetical protein